MRWKICGLKDPANMEAILAEIKPDYVGLIFYRGSARFVGEAPPEKLPNFPSATQKVGVFVNQTADEICQAAANYRLQLLQLHGSESPEFCRYVSEKTRLPVIKAFSVGDAVDFSQLTAYEEAVSYFLFDTKGKNHGGNGVAFNWELLKSYPLQKPFFLSGGIGMSQASEIAGLDFPLLHAIDVNSRFETAPGIKNVELLRRFKAAVGL